jgi:hypothetical protein
METSYQTNLAVLVSSKLLFSGTPTYKQRCCVTPLMFTVLINLHDRYAQA